MTGYFYAKCGARRLLAADLPQRLNPICFTNCFPGRPLPSLLCGFASYRPIPPVRSRSSPKSPSLLLPVSSIPPLPWTVAMLQRLQIFLGKPTKFTRHQLMRCNRCSPASSQTALGGVFPCRKTYPPVPPIILIMTGGFKVGSEAVLYMSFFAARHPFPWR